MDTLIRTTPYDLYWLLPFLAIDVFFVAGDGGSDYD